MDTALPVGRVHGHRGNTGEITVRVAAGDAEHWVGVRRVLIGPRIYDVTDSRAYRDRLVLRLAGIDDGNSAAALRGGSVRVAREDAPALPGGRHYRADLVGMRVTAGDRSIGTVEDVQPGAAHDLLVVEREQGGPALIPFVDEIVRDVDDSARTIRIDPPAGLLEINEEADDAI